MWFKKKKEVLKGYSYRMEGESSNYDVCIGMTPVLEWAAYLTAKGRYRFGCGALILSKEEVESFLSILYTWIKNTHNSPIQITPQQIQDICLFLDISFEKIYSRQR